MQTPIRIWAQSAGDLTVHARYRDTIAEHGARVCGDVDIAVHGFRPGTYPAGVTAAQLCCDWRYTHELASLQIVENAIRAEQEGYDLFLVTSFMDHGVSLARTVVDIPVIGLAEPSLFVGMTIAGSMGLISPQEGQARVVRRLVRQYGVADRVSKVAVLDPPITPDLLDGEIGSSALGEAFCESAARTFGPDVDLIVPCEGLLCSALYHSGVRDVAGTPVLDVFGAAFAFGAMLARLRAVSTVQTSRGGFHAKPTKQAVDHLRDVTRAVLDEAASVYSGAGVDGVAGTSSRNTGR